MQKASCPICGDSLKPEGTCPKDGSKAVISVELEPGSQIDKYVLEAKLSEGGMGEVWKGSHKLVQKKVALKVLRSDLISNKQAIIRLRREALSVNSIRNKHIVDIFDFGELADGRPYFVMEFLEGEPLSEYLSNKGPLPFSEILHVLGQVCEALTAAHAKEIIHRDLKPENIFLVTEKGGLPFVKVLDFGIAKFSASDKEEQHSITRTGSIFGTPTYMSPEQCEGTKTVDYRSDLYSLGIILFELLTGRTPFVEPGEGVGIVMAKHLTTPAPPPSTFVSGRIIPMQVDALVLRALSKIPAERPKSATEFYNGLVTAVGSQRDEGQDATQNAKPLSSNLSVRAIPIPSPESSDRKTRTGDYYASPAPPVSGLNLSPPVSHKRPQVIIGSALLSLALGSLGYLLFASSEAPKESPVKTPATIQAQSQPASVKAPIAPKTVTLSIQSDPPGAKVLLGEQLLGDTPLQVEIPYSEEEAKLRVEREGFKGQEFTFVPKSAYAASATLKPLPKVKNPKTKTGSDAKMLFED